MDEINDPVIVVFKRDGTKEYEVECVRCDGDRSEPGAPDDEVDGTPLCGECLGRGSIPLRKFNLNARMELALRWYAGECQPGEVKVRAVMRSWTALVDRELLEGSRNTVTELGRRILAAMAQRDADREVPDGRR